MLSSDHLEGDVRAITAFTFSTAWHKLWPLRPHELWGWQVLQTAVVGRRRSNISRVVSGRGAGLGGCTVGPLPGPGGDEVLLRAFLWVGAPELAAGRAPWGLRTADPRAAGLSHAICPG